MKLLMDMSAALNVTVEVGDLPPGERARYIPSQRRIILRNGGFMETYKSLSLALNSVRAADTDPTARPSQPPNHQKEDTTWPVNRSSLELGGRSSAKRMYLAALM